MLADDLGQYNPAQWRLYQWAALATGGVAKVEFPSTSEMAPGIAFWLIVEVHWYGNETIGGLDSIG